MILLVYNKINQKLFDILITINLKVGVICRIVPNIYKFSPMVQPKAMLL